VPPGFAASCWTRRGLYEGVDCPRIRSLAELVTRLDAGDFEQA